MLQLDTDGFVVIEGFLSNDVIELLKKQVDNLIQQMPDDKNRAIFTTSNSESAQVKATVKL